MSVIDGCVTLFVVTAQPQSAEVIVPVAVTGLVLETSLYATLTCAAELTSTVLSDVNPLPHVGTPPAWALTIHAIACSAACASVGVAFEVGEADEPPEADTASVENTPLSPMAIPPSVPDTDCETGMLSTPCFSGLAPSHWYTTT